ncbi:hypothetical protein FE257_006080 [Aspergillus nanangensis]|uniref:DUF1212 domain membrane protein n=1 Tax=Aspergillus nanangensis TaxID=2582783 RepID=A0AAD4GV38_ASPNN|nr:hypothetical protein FE257_006080 [Aspergillus nanangensis]
MSAGNPQQNEKSSSDQQTNPGPVREEDLSALEKQEQEDRGGAGLQEDTLSTSSTSLFSRERWLDAGRAVKEKTERIAEVLNRPTHHGEQGLGSSMIHPEELGSTDDDRLAAIFRDDGSNEHSNQSKYQLAMNAEAQEMIQGLRYRQSQRRHETDAGGASLRKSDTSATLVDHLHAHAHEDANGGGETAQSGFSGGVLSALLQLQANQMNQQSRRSSFYSSSEGAQSQPMLSGTVTPTPEMAHSASSPSTKQKPPHWYNKPKHKSTASLVRASMNMGQIGSSSAWSTASVPKVDDNNKAGGHKKKKKSKKDEEEVKLTVHIADILFRQRYIMQLCRAFMRYGAPTHRLEEYMQMTARVLDIEAQFMYLPGCMIMSFDDPVTRTAEVKLIRVPQGLDLGRLEDVHHCYKRVTHDMVDMQTAISELTELMDRKPRYNKWLVILLYGLGSAAVGPFGFTARPIDMPIIFVLGCCVGVLQHVLAPQSALYSNVFEVTAAILVSFLARAFGSIRLPGHKDPIFCYASITQSSIALILPGFSVLTSSLELQSHQMIAGSIRLVYTILYSLFLGYGVTVGTTIYGAIDDNATSDTTCARQDIWGSPYTQRFPFVALYCLIAALINQAKFKQTPMMILIGTSGYVTNYFSTQKLGSSSQVANTVGAFTIGLLANLYSRLWHGNAVSVTIPGIFTLVPSGLASSGSILSAIEYSDSVKNNTANTSGGSSGSTLTSLGFGMIQTAIGITVGLFISALVVYPQGKRRSGLFSL